MQTETIDIAPPTATTLKKYGMGVGPHALAPDPTEDWLAILQGQGWVCGVCGQVPSVSKSTGKRRLVIDHEHVRGWKNMAPEQRRAYVRGLTCWFCNSTYLGRGLTIAKAEGVVRYLKAYAARRPS